MVQLKKINENVELPKMASELAGAYDVKASKIEKVSDDFYICYLGFALTPNEGQRVMISPRSGITKTKWIMQNSPGVGDEDYTGEYQIRFRCIPSGFDIENNKFIYEEFPYKIGERVGQIYLENVIPMEFEVVEELKETKRGSGGFNSTGK